MFRSPRLLGTEAQDKSGLYCANACFLGVSCDSSSRLPHSGVLGAGWQCFPSFKGSFVPSESRACAVCGLGPRAVPGCHSALLLQEDAAAQHGPSSRGDALCPCVQRAMAGLSPGLLSLEGAGGIRAQLGSEQ